MRVYLYNRRGNGIDFVQLHDAGGRVAAGMRGFSFGSGHERRSLGRRICWAADGDVLGGLAPGSRSQMLTRGDDAEFRFDDFNRWAKPLDEAVHRVVTANPDSIFDDVVVVSFPYGHLAALDHQLVGRVGWQCRARNSVGHHGSGRRGSHGAALRVIAD